MKSIRNEDLEVNFVDIFKENVFNRNNFHDY